MYRERIADIILDEALKSAGAVLIQGPKWCGKTTTGEHIAKSAVFFDDPLHYKQNLILLDTDPQQILFGEFPRLIDEWQLAPKLWDIIRFYIDRKSLLGAFVLTGSAVPADSAEIHHTGTGRFAWVKMYPMSLYESGESRGEVSLSSLFDSSYTIRGTSALSFDDIAFLICRGGWPQSVGQNRAIALRQAHNYYNAVVNEDISRIEGIRKDTEYVKRLMRSYARHQGTQASVETILGDLCTNEENDPCGKTLSKYIKALERIFVIENVKAWNPNLRSKTAIRTSDTRYFTDPSIAASSLGISPEDIARDMNTAGLLFETLAIRDLRVYASALGADLYHYRDKNGLECDAVIHFDNGKYGLVEIKIGGDMLIDEGAVNLLKLSSKINTSKMQAPSFCMVLTAVGDRAYRRPDGICVVPIGTLKY